MVNKTSTDLIELEIKMILNKYLYNRSYISGKMYRFVQNKILTQISKEETSVTKNYSLLNNLEKS